LMQGCWWQWR